MAALLEDLRQAARGHTKTPAFTLVVSTLASASTRWWRSATS